MPTRLIFGCGYLGRRVAQRWLDGGDRVIAVTRREETAAAFRSAGIEPLVADVTHEESLADLPVADTLLFAVGYDRTAAPSIHEVYAEGFRRVLAAAPAGTGRVLYISTTGVYGDAAGEWVDESTPPAPARDGGRASLAAESGPRPERLGRPLGRPAARGDLRPRAGPVPGRVAGGGPDRSAE